MNVLRNFTILVAFYGKIATFSDSEKIQYFFSKNPSVFLKKKHIFWTFWEILLFQSHFTANLLPLAILKKFNIFFSKNQSIFLRTQTLNVLRNLTFLVAFYGKFATFSNSEKIQYFSRKTHLFLWKKNPIFERFEKFYYFSRISRQICYL